MREALRSLGRDPSGRSNLLDVRTLDGEDRPLFRLRVGGWRAVFEIRGDEIIVWRVFARAEGYTWLDTFHF